MTSTDGVHFQCQDCKKVLTVGGKLQGDSLPPALAQHHGATPILGASLFAGGRGDESFVVLDKAAGPKRPLGDGSGKSSAVFLQVGGARFFSS